MKSIKMMRRHEQGDESDIAAMDLGVRSNDGIDQVILLRQRDRMEQRTGGKFTLDDDGIPTFVKENDRDKGRKPSDME